MAQLNPEARRQIWTIGHEITELTAAYNDPAYDHTVSLLIDRLREVRDAATSATEAAPDGQ